MLRGTYGPVDMSTAMSLVRVPQVIWDVNGYYRSLNIPFPFRPTKGQLRLGYLHSAKNVENERLTYYLTQLLDPEIRAKYDATPLGEVFDDKYVKADNKAKLAKVAAEMSEEEGTLITVDDLIEESNTEGDLPELAAGNYQWDWGYFLMKSRKYDVDALMLWQEMLVRSFHDAGLVETIAIGYVGRDKREFVIVKHEDKMVFFLNEEIEPSEELSQTAVSRYQALWTNKNRQRKEIA